MRIIGLIIAVNIVGVFASFAGNEPTLFKEINRKTIIDLKNTNLKAGMNYTNVIFKVHKDRIRIIDLEGSSKELKDKVKVGLEKIVLKESYDETKTYRYRFIFEQE